MNYRHGPAHEAASWRFSVFARRKLQLKSRDPIRRYRMMRSQHQRTESQCSQQK
jgi:hypothetical protein